MLESIRTLTDVPPCEDGRLAREDIRAARQRRLMLDEAQRRASQLIAQAQSEADDIRAFAFQDGYSQGIVAASHDLAQLLVESQTLTRQLQQDLARAASQLLRQLLQRDEWLDQVLAQWLAEQDSKAPATLQVLLPQRCKGQGQTLAEGLREQWPGTLNIEYHAQERYLLRLGDQVLEFDIDSIQARMTTRLLAKLDDLPPAIRSLDQRSTEALQQLVGRQLGLAEAESYASSEFEEGIAPHD